MRKGTWELGFAFRRLTADHWLVGTVPRPDQAPFGKPLSLHINSFDTTATYGITSRVSLSATTPFVHGAQSRYYADGLQHTVSAGGLGDVNATLRTWVWTPAQHPDGNLQVGVGVKTATGQHDADAAFYGLPGTDHRPVDQSIELGDGGWGLIGELLAFHRVPHLGYVFGSGSYLASPKNTTELFQQPVGPYAKARVSVPDVFSVKGGASFMVWPRFGVSATLGARLDGIPLRDVFGASDGFRRPALVGYVDPSVTITHGSSTFEVDVPVRTYYDFRRSLLDKQLGTAGGGDLASYLLFVGYTYRLGQAERVAAGRVR